MTFQPGLFVRPWLTNPDDPESVRGTGPGDARKALEGIFPNTGVVDGLTVTGTTAWAYTVAAGHYVINRPGNGSILAPNDAPVEVATDPAPGTGSRIDIVYVKHNDPDQGDPDGLPYVAVAKGVASGTPAPPAIPAGALELARKTVTAGDTNTQSGAAVQDTAPYVGLSPRVYTSGTPAGGTFTTSQLVVSCNIPAAPYRRLVSAQAVIYGVNIAATWDAALSDLVSQWENSQYFGRFPNPQGSVTIPGTFILEAGQSTTLRGWVGYRSGGNQTFTASSDPKYSRIVATVFRL